MLHRHLTNLRLQLKPFFIDIKPEAATVREKIELVEERTFIILAKLWIVENRILPLVDLLFPFGSIAKCVFGNCNRSRWFNAIKSCVSPENLFSYFLQKCLRSEKPLTVDKCDLFDQTGPTACARRDKIQCGLLFLLGAACYWIRRLPVREPFL